MNKLFFIANPSSGEQKATDVSDRIQTIYENKGYETRTYLTEGDDHFTKIVQEAMADGFETVAIMGGDGTVSALVNGIASLEKRPNILLVPTGTTNNFAQSLGSELDLDQLLVKLENDEVVVKETDIGVINDQYFVSSVAIGELPTVGWRTDEDLKARLGSFAYVLEGLKVMGEESQDSFDIEIQADGELLHKENIFLLVIGLSNSIFGIPTFFYDAAYNDGKLHIFGLKKSTIFKEANAIMKYFLMDDEQTDPADELIFTHSFTHAVLKSSTDLNYLIDGEKGEHFPLELGVLHKHLTFLVVESE